MEKQVFQTTYYVATHWLHNNLILCNEIANEESIVDNARFDWYNENDNPIEIFQWFITDCSDDDVNFLEDHFGLMFTYSDTLNLWVLCVPYYGTDWDYIPCDCDFENAKAELGKNRK